LNGDRAVTLLNDKQSSGCNSVLLQPARAKRATSVSSAHSRMRWPSFLASGWWR